MHTLNTQVLKYSNEDLMKLVQLARRRANQRERQKVEQWIYAIVLSLVPGIFGICFTEARGLRSINAIIPLISHGITILCLVGTANVDTADSGY